MMRFLMTAVVALGFLSGTPVLHAGEATPYSGTQTIDTGQAFDAYEQKLLASISANKMGVVAQACADCGARNFFKKEIAKNRVIMIFHPRFAVPMLEASVPAGIEAPLRLYVTEQKDGTARLIYRLPSHVFAPYKEPTLDKIAVELDAIVAKIVSEAAK